MARRKRTEIEATEAQSEDSADVEAAPPRRRRHDPDPRKSVTDGDYRKDRVHGCKPGTNIVRIPGSPYDGMRVAFVSADDRATYLARGAVKVKRGELSPRPEYDIGTDEGGDYDVGGLKLMALTEENYQKSLRPGRAVAEQRRSALRKDSLRRGQFAAVQEEEYSRQSFGG